MTEMPMTMTWWWLWPPLTVLGEGGLSCTLPLPTRSSVVSETNDNVWCIVICDSVTFSSLKHYGERSASIASGHCEGGPRRDGFKSIQSSTVIGGLSGFERSLELQRVELFSLLHTGWLELANYSVWLGVPRTKELLVICCTLFATWG